MDRNQAIELIKRATVYTDEEREALELLIPDLKESEDERIRKELIEFIKWSVDRHFMREDFHQAKRPSEWIAYLEKQEQKPAWSEEDENKLKQCIRIVTGWEADYDVVKSPYSNFLKSLRPQPKAEWSEEDERMFSRCVKSIESSKQFADSDTFKKAKDNEIDWLENRVKRICPPYKEQWRPTKEQLDAVRWLLDKYKPWMISSADARKKLRSLLNDLEKNYGL